jgi:ArsR family transcriptional regulator
MSRITKARPAAPVTARELVAAAKAIGHPARLRILAMLQGRTLCVCQLTSVLELAFSTVSGHLNELRRSGLVSEDKQGKLVFYRLKDRSPFAGLLADALALTREDDECVRDREVIDRVRKVPVEVLTGAGLNLERVGIRRRSSADRVGRARQQND